MIEWQEEETVKAYEREARIALPMPAALPACLKEENIVESKEKNRIGRAAGSSC